MKSQSTSTTCSKQLNISFCFPVSRIVSLNLLKVWLRHVHRLCLSVRYEQFFIYYKYAHSRDRIQRNVKVCVYCIKVYNEIEILRINNKFALTMAVYGNNYIMPPKKRHVDITFFQRKFQIM